MGKDSMLKIILSVLHVPFMEKTRRDTVPTQGVPETGFYVSHAFVSAVRPDWRGFRKPG